MCTFFNCAAYKDIDATIRLDGQVVFLALNDTLDRKIAEPTVTELIAGTRETFLKKVGRIFADVAQAR